MTHIQRSKYFTFRALGVVARAAHLMAQDKPATTKPTPTWQIQGCAKYAATIDKPQRRRTAEELGFNW